MAWTSAHCIFACETFFKIDESVIATQSDFHVPFILHWNFQPIVVSVFFLEQHQKALCIAIIDSTLLKNISAANTWCVTVQAMIVTDYIWKNMVRHYLDGAYHYHFSKSPCTTQVTVENVGGISVILYNFSHKMIKYWYLWFIRKLAFYKKILWIYLSIGDPVIEWLYPCLNLEK